MSPLIYYCWWQTTEFIGKRYVACYENPLVWLCSKSRSYNANNSNLLDDILEKYCDVFDSEPGKTKDVLVNIPVPSETKSIFYKARPVPLSDGSVRISDGSVRICGDYKVTVNKVTQCDIYPVPRILDLLVTLNRGERFSKLYLSHAYQQLVLGEGSRK